MIVGSDLEEEGAAAGAAEGAASAEGAAAAEDSDDLEEDDLDDLEVVDATFCEVFFLPFFLGLEDVEEEEEVVFLTLPPFVLATRVDLDLVDDLAAAGEDAFLVLFFLEAVRLDAVPAFFFVVLVFLEEEELLAAISSIAATRPAFSVFKGTTFNCVWKES